MTRLQRELGALSGPALLDAVAEGFQSAVLVRREPSTKAPHTEAQVVAGADLGHGVASIVLPMAKVHLEQLKVLTEALVRDVDADPLITEKGIPEAQDQRLFHILRLHMIRNSAYRLKSPIFPE